MFKDIFLFELKYRFSRPATWIYFALLLIVPLLLIGFGNTPASEKVYHNSPIVIANLLLAWSDDLFLETALALTPHDAAAFRTEIRTMRCDVTAGQYLDIFESVAWRNVDLRDARRLRDFPRDCVLAAAGPDQENVHACNLGLDPCFRPPSRI